MAAPIVIGVDCTDILMHAAIGWKNTIRKITESNRGFAERAAITPDPNTNVAGLGIGFPSVLQLVGSGRQVWSNTRPSTVDELVTQALQTMRGAVVATTNADMALATVVAPASFGEARRRALANAAKAADLPETELIEAALACAALVRGLREEPQTVLMYRLGYGPFEAALVRVTPDYARVLDTVVTHEASGELLDAMVIERIVRGLQEAGIFLGLKTFRNSQWRRLREVASKGRDVLLRAPNAMIGIPAHIAHEPSDITLTLSQEPMRAMAGKVVRRTLELIDRMLESNDVSSDAIDTVVALGKDAIEPDVLGRLWDRFPDRIWTGGDEAIAAGAVLHGVRKTAPGSDAIMLQSVRGRILSPADAALSHSDAPAPYDNQPFITEIRRGAVAAEAESAEGDDAAQDLAGFSHIRQLIDDGKLEEADEAARAHLEAIEALRRQIGQKSEHDPRQLIQQAERLLGDWRYAEAVALSHRAFELAPADAAVFDCMMEIHAQAGLDMSSVDQYDDAIQILMCAHRHDKSDVRVLRVLGERHFRQGQALAARNDHDGALIAVKAALRYNPQHEEAHKLYVGLTSDGNG